MTNKSVMMCVCHRRTFEEVRHIAADKGLASLEELIEHRICGTGCAMCHPYVRAMLATGETAFRIGDWGNRSA